MEIFIASKEFRNDDLIQRLERSPDWSSREIRLLLRKSDQEFRTIDSTVLVAVVSALGAGVGALISGLLNIAKESKTNKLIIKDKNGRTLEIPAEYPMEKVKELVQILREMETAKIEIE